MSFETHVRLNDNYKEKNRILGLIKYYFCTFAVEVFAELDKRLVKMTLKMWIFQNGWESR